MHKAKTTEAKPVTKDEFSVNADAMIEILLALKKLPMKSRVRVMRMVQAYFA